MTSGPVVVVALERENAVAHWRKVIGATDPAKGGRRHDSQAVRREPWARTPCTAPIRSRTAAFECGYYFQGSELGDPATSVPSDARIASKIRADAYRFARPGSGW